MARMHTESIGNITVLGACPTAKAIELAIKEAWSKNLPEHLAGSDHEIGSPHNIQTFLYDFKERYEKTVDDIIKMQLPKQAMKDADTARVYGANYSEAALNQCYVKYTAWLNAVKPFFEHKEGHLPLTESHAVKAWAAIQASSDIFSEAIAIRRHYFRLYNNGDLLGEAADKDKTIPLLAYMKFVHEEVMQNLPHKAYAALNGRG